MVCKLCSEVTGEIAGLYSEICRYKGITRPCTVGDWVVVVVVVGGWIIYVEIHNSYLLNIGRAAGIV